jgi:hypothetical protein
MVMELEFVLLLSNQKKGDYSLLALLSLLSLLILFFLHFHRMFPRFFQSLELLFNVSPHYLFGYKGFNLTFISHNMELMP